MAGPWRHRASGSAASAQANANPNPNHDPNPDPNPNPKFGAIGRISGMTFVTGFPATTCSKPAAAPCNEFRSRVLARRHVARHVALGSRPAPNVHRFNPNESFSQPDHIRQRAVGPRCGRRSRSRSYKLGIFTTAPPAQSCRHLCDQAPAAPPDAGEPAESAPTSLPLEVFLERDKGNWRKYSYLA